jgi:hypothetical protein
MTVDANIGLDMPSDGYEIRIHFCSYDPTTSEHIRYIIEYSDEASRSLHLGEQSVVENNRGVEVLFPDLLY